MPESKYRPEFCQTVIEVGERGGWVAEMAEACDVHRHTFRAWEREHPEFAEALARAKQKAQAWFERVGRLGLTAKQFNAVLWKYQMTGRHPEEYAERYRAELTGANGQPLIPEYDPRQVARAVLAVLSTAQIEALAQQQQAKLPPVIDGSVASRG